MRAFRRQGDWWRSRGLRFQLATTIAVIGLLLSGLNIALLNVFLDRYVTGHHGTALAQQAATISRCGSQGVALQLLRGGRPAESVILAAMAPVNERHAVVVNSGGIVRYATPMSAPLRTLLIGRLRTDLKLRRLTSLRTPSWHEMDGEIVVDIVITCRIPTSQAASNAGTFESGGMLLAEDSAVPAREQQDLFNLVIAIGLAVTGLAILAALVAADRIAGSVRSAASAARAVARGNYESRLVADGPAEITEMAVAFNSMVKEVVRQRRVERDLLANISHELASPLSLIRGYAEALADKIIDAEEERTDALRAVRDESARLQRLTEDLLDLALLETGQVSMHVEDVPVAELLVGLQARMAPLARRAAVTMSVDASTDLPLLPVDVQRLEQVLVNLLNNALRHTQPGGTITMSARQQEGGLELTVTDTGSGIPSDELPRIWERFYQVETDRDRRTRRGLGLGLAISQSTIIVMRGTIDVESTVGTGTTFRIWLPLDQ